ncbi:MAG: STAS domain-containing protein [Clostridia bacterium]|nr:STAS domain-containing protein [Clostridia bacterium]
MDIRSITDGSRLAIALEGKLDTNTAPQLEKAIFLSLEGVEELTLDFDKLDYISSAGLRVLIKAEKEMSKRGGMRIVRANEAIRGIFEISGLNEMLTVE